MTDLNLNEIQNITRLAKKSEPFLSELYPYIDEYKELNEAILEKSKQGENCIDFDFIDSKLKNDESLEDILKNNRRIYPHNGICYALYNTYNYPFYLTSKGFKVEIRQSQKRHGYVSKSYHISW